MKITRRTALILLLVGSVAAWVYLVLLERSYQEDPNYSLIADGLYMGGDVGEPPPGTDAVLNLCELEDPYQCDSHRWEPIRDRAPGPGMAWIQRMVEYVDGKRRGGLTVYVHCRNGVSRSGMVVVAYFMYKNHWTRDRALEFVRSNRPVTKPNPAFMKRLAEWERTLKK